MGYTWRGFPDHARMPWKEATPVDERRRLIELVLDERLSVTTASHALGVSRKTAHKWLSRHREHGLAGLTDQSRAPRSQPHAMSDAIRETLLSLRRKHGDGPHQILFLAARALPGVRLPCVSTVAELFRREGLVASGRRWRSPSLHRTRAGLGESRRPNEVWTADHKGRIRVGRRYAYPLTVMDHWSRLVLGIDVHESTGTEESKRSFLRIFRDFGLPDRIHTDNGTPFASPGLGGLSRLSVWWMKQDIEVTRSRPSSPQDNARHERLHRTLKERTARPPAETLCAQRRRTRDFVRWMNEERLHRSLGCTPAEVYARSAREYVERPREWEYGAHAEVRLVRSNGSVKLGGAYISVARALYGERVGLEEIGEDLWRILFRRTVLGVAKLRGDRVEMLAPETEPESEDDDA